MRPPLLTPEEALDAGLKLAAALPVLRWLLIGAQIMDRYNLSDVLNRLRFW